MRTIRLVEVRAAVKLIRAELKGVESSDTLIISAQRGRARARARDRGSGVINHLIFP